MDDLGVIDRFLNIFSQYIDTGFGLLNGEVAFLTATLVAIDIALVAMFWALGGGSAEDVISKLIRKVLYVGAFAFIITNFQALSTILLQSFAGLGLTATGSGIPAAELLSPGRLATVGVDAGRPIMDQIGNLAGFPEVFVNLDQIVVLLLAWLIVIVSFFILAVQLFVTLIEFKLTTLAGFVLVPFALWNKTAFLAERVLGNVVSSGIKVLVLAVIVGIGTGIFGEFNLPPGAEVTLDHALAIMLASLALFGLGLFGPGIATGLVSGGPQLSASTATNSAIAAGSLVAAGAGIVAGGARALGAAGRTGKAGYDAFKTGASKSGTSGATAARAGFANVFREGGSAVAERLRRRFSAGRASDAASVSDAPRARSQSRTHILRNALMAAQVMRSAHHGGSGANPSLKD